MKSRFSAGFLLLSMLITAGLLPGVRMPAGAESPGKEAQQLSRELDELNRDLMKTYTVIEKVAGEVVLIREKRERSRLEVESLERQLLSLKERARSRLVAYYKFSQLGYALPLLTAEHFRDLLDVARVVGLILRSDHRTFVELREKTALLEAARSELESREAELAERQEELEERRQELFAEKEEKIRLLVSLYRQERARREADSNSSEEESGRAADTVVGRVPEPPGESFEARRGQLPLPVKGKILKAGTAKKTSPEGDILYNNGVIVRTTPGTPVRAVHDGTVVFSDWFKGYGNVIIVDHGEHYHTLIARLGTLYKKAGERVKAGEIVADAGNGEKNPRVYFEIRHHGEPVNPETWLGR